MRAPLASQSDLGLLFTWEEPRRRSAAITGFVLASLLLHALCFYAFQIIYPPAVALLPPPGRVTIIAPNTAAERVFLRWLDAEDPALASTTQPLDQRSPSVPISQHAPSYMSHQPSLKAAPPSNAEAAIPNAQPPTPVHSTRSPIQPTPISPTHIRFSPELEVPSTNPVPEMKFQSSGQAVPEAALFRVAAGREGDIRYCFLENSSGDPALDEQARKYLTQFRFSMPDTPASGNIDNLVWGTATIEWGNDITTPVQAAARGVAP